jgi:hypothetical protein
MAVDLEIMPAESAICAVQKQTHRIGRTLDAYFDEALEERYRVKIEHRGQRFGSDGQAPSCFTHNHRGHFHRGVWRSSLARIASVLG